MNPLPARQRQTAGGRVGLNLVFAKPLGASATELQQRKRIGQAAAKIENPDFGLTAIFKLSGQQGHRIAGRQGVARLMSPTAEADVFERTPAQTGVNPKTDDALISPPELSRARQQATAVDPNWKAERFAVFQRKDLRSQFAGAVE